MKIVNSISRFLLFHFHTVGSKVFSLLFLIAVSFILTYGQQEVNSPSMVVKPLNINTIQSEIGGIPHNNNLYFCSNRGRKYLFKKAYRSRPNYRLFCSVKASDSQFSKPKTVKKQGSAILHTGPITFYRDKALVTQSVMRGNQSELGIIEYQIAGDQWHKKGEIELDNTIASNYHPTLHSKGEWLIFSSDRAGGFGGADLYASYWVDSSWSSPYNLGPAINTAGNECFPFLLPDSTLYFSSNGHDTGKDLDIFAVNLSGHLIQSPIVKSLPFPLNSPHDDFGISWDSENQKGFFCSDRPLINEGETPPSNDNLFFFQPTGDCWFQFENVAVGEPLAHHEITVQSSHFREQKQNTDQAGRISLPIAALQQRTDSLRFKTPGFETISLSIQELTFPPQESDIRVNLVPETPPQLEVYLQDSSGKYSSPLSVKVIPDARPEETKLLTLIPNQPHLLALDLTESYQFEVTHNFGVIGAGTYIPQDSLQPLTLSLNAHPLIRIEGVVYKQNSQTPIPGAAVRIIQNENRSTMASTQTDEAGRFVLWSHQDSIHHLSIFSSATGFYSHRYDLTSGESQTPGKMTFTLKLAEYGNNKVVKTIYYDFNQSNLRLLSQKDLNEIYYFMIENPEAVIELSSFTDARGPAPYNLTLSQERAESVVQFIVDNRSIPRDRIIPKGYGETRLVNHCKDGVSCSEQEHQLNRRTEIKVTHILFSKK